MNLKGVRGHRRRDTVGRERAANDMNTVCIYEILKNIYKF